MATRKKAGFKIVKDPPRARSKANRRLSQSDGHRKKSTRVNFLIAEADVSRPKLVKNMSARLALQQEALKKEKEAIRKKRGSI